MLSNTVIARPGRRARLVLTGLLLLMTLLMGAQMARRTAEAGAFSTSAPAATLAYSTYLGGNSADWVRAMTVDSQGNIYVTGDTFSVDFLGHNTTPYGYSDIYVAKLDPTGKQVLYLTTVSSSDADQPHSIAVDGQGNVYVTVLNYADDFPLLNPLWDEYPHYSHDAALFKLDAAGNPVYSTLLPLNIFDTRSNVAVDAAGNVYVVGADRTDEEGFQIALLKLNPAGTQPLMQKLYGGPDLDTAAAVAVDSAGVIYITGRTEGGTRDSFPTTANAIQPECGDMTFGDNSYCFEDGVVLVYDAAGQVLYSSYHGGSFTDNPVSIAADGQGNILIAGNTTSGAFPLKNALQATCPIDPNSGDCYTDRGFVSLMKLNNGQASLVYSTYLGSSESYSVNTLTAATMAPGGQATVAGYTNGEFFPTAAPVQAGLALGLCTTFSSERFCFDNFITTLTPAGGLAFSTYLGGNDDEFPYGVRVGGNGAVYVAGMTQASDFPTTAGALQANNLISDDGFLSRIDSGVTPPPPPPPPPPGPYRAYVPGVMR